MIDSFKGKSEPRMSSSPRYNLIREVNTCPRPASAEPQELIMKIEIYADVLCP